MNNPAGTDGEEVTRRKSRYAYIFIYSDDEDVETEKKDNAGTSTPPAQTQAVDPCTSVVQQTNSYGENVADRSRFTPQLELENQHGSCFQLSDDYDDDVDRYEDHVHAALRDLEMINLVEVEADEYGQIMSLNDKLKYLKDGICPPRFEPQTSFKLSDEEDEVELEPQKLQNGGDGHELKYDDSRFQLSDEEEDDEFPQRKADDSRFKLSDEEEDEDELPQRKADDSRFKLSDEEEDEDELPQRKADDSRFKLSDEEDEDELPQRKADSPRLKLSDEEDENGQLQQKKADELRFKSSNEEEDANASTNEANVFALSDYEDYEPQPREEATASTRPTSMPRQEPQQEAKRPNKEENRFVFNSGYTKVCEPPPTRNVPIRPTFQDREVGMGAQVCSNVYQAICMQLGTSVPPADDEDWSDVDEDAKEPNKYPAWYQEKVQKQPKLVKERTQRRN